MNRYRQAAVRENLRVRAEMLRLIRAFFADEGFLEVETPVRLPAVVPEVHIEPVPSDGWLLQTSPEACMKRLLAAGYPKIFQICKCFRRGERGERHLVEFTMLEWYEAPSDYFQMMEQCERLLHRVFRDFGLSGALTYQGTTVNFKTPWERMTVHQAFERYAGMSPEAALAEGRFDEIMGIEVEPFLGRERPLFLYDYPAECGALARLRDGAPTVAERFELYIAGMELCNAFSELTDAAEQRRRFEHDQEARRRLGKPVHPVPERFLDALADMPPAAGNALGIDRLAMLLTDAPTVDAVVAFAPEEL